MKIANKARGEVRVEIDGEPYIMCLTLGAMAKIETVTEADSLADIGRKLSDPKTGHIVGVVQALLEGGGNPVDDQIVAGWPASTLISLQGAIGEVFAASGMGGEDAGEEDDFPQPKSPSPGANGSAPVSAPLSGVGSDMDPLSSGA